MRVGWSIPRWIEKESRKRERERWISKNENEIMHFVGVTVSVYLYSYYHHYQWWRIQHKHLMLMCSKGIFLRQFWCNNSRIIALNMFANYNAFLSIKDFIQYFFNEPCLLRTQRRGSCQCLKVCTYTPRCAPCLQSLHSHFSYLATLWENCQ